MTVSMMKISSGKIQNFQHSNYSPKELDYEDFQIIGHWMKRILQPLEETNLSFPLSYFFINN